jgi:hypothetical protein
MTRKVVNEGGKEVEVDTIVPTKERKYPDNAIGAARYDKEYSAVEKTQERYTNGKRELMSKMLLAMEENISVQVQQHELYQKEQRISY